MFRRKAPNLEEVRKQLIKLLTDTLAEYRKHPNPQKTDTIMHYVSLIDPKSYIYQAFEIYTRDVAKYVYKNVASGAPKTLIGEELLKPMSPELVDLYILTLWGLNDRFTGTPALGNVFLLAATNYHNKRAIPLIQAHNWAEAEAELQNA